MIANRFRAVGWVAGVAAAALVCYLISLQVAAERGQLMKLERRILTARADIRQLRTELDTRGRLVQLERWNADVLGLEAPKASQYAQGEVQLAGYMQPAKPAPQVIPVVAHAPVAAMPQVVTASYSPVRIDRHPPAPAPVVQAPPAPRTATAAPKLVPQPEPQAQPMVRHATYLAPAAKTAIVPVALRKPAAKSALLGDDLLGEIGHRAAAEAKKR